MAAEKIEDSNMALYGSEAHKKATAAAAALEAHWEGAGQAAGVQIWRVENHKARGGAAASFGISVWPEERHGEFYDGDSYIVLRTREVDGVLDHSIFYWIGKHSTQDERGVAAYKTVELDDALGGEPLETRIVQGGETKGFLACFAKPPIFMSGGIESGFKNVKPEEYKPRLLHCKGKGKKVRCMQTAFSAASMNRGDCFILDGGTRLFQWNGPEAGAWEKRKAHEVLVDINADRQRGAIDMERPVVLDDDDYPEFWEALGGSPDQVQPASAGGDDSIQAKRDDPVLYECSDADGSLDCEKIAEGDAVKKSLLDTGSVYILDKGNQIYIWVGAGAGKAEKSEAMIFAEKFLASNDMNECTPLIRIHEKDNAPPKGFTSGFSDE